MPHRKQQDVYSLWDHNKLKPSLLVTVSSFCKSTHGQAKLQERWIQGLHQMLRRWQTDVDAAARPWR